MKCILSEMKRLADPYRDLDVIDARAPRFNQATVGLLAVVAVATGWWWLLAALGAQLVVGLTFGRQFCLPCLVYFEVVQPRFGEGRLEDSPAAEVHEQGRRGDPLGRGSRLRAGRDSRRRGSRQRRRRARAARRGDRLLRRLRGLQARLGPDGQAVRLVPDPGGR